jgi:hypothetical protein
MFLEKFKIHRELKIQARNKMMGIPVKDNIKIISVDQNETTESVTVEHIQQSDQHSAQALKQKLFSEFLQQHRIAHLEKHLADWGITGKEDFEFLTQDDLSMLPIIDQRKLKKLCKKENGNGEKKLEIYGKKIADERFTGNDPDISYGVEGKTQNDSAPDLIIGGGLY